MDNHNIENNFFDILGKNIIIIGQSQSGKTTLVRDLYSKVQNHIQEIHIFSNVTSWYTDITNAIYHDFAVLNGFICQCEEDAQNEVPISKLLIIENIIDMKQIELLLKFMLLENYSNITIMLTIQTPLTLTQEYRSIFDYIFTSNHDFYSNKRKLYDLYFGFIKSFDDFCAVLNTLDNYQFLCTKNNPHRETIKYIPSIHKDIKFIPTRKIKYISDK